MKTSQEYVDSLREMKPVVYAFGERVDSVVDHPCFRPTVNAVALTYELSQETEHDNLMTVTSPMGLIIRKLQQYEPYSGYHI